VLERIKVIPLRLGNTKAWNNHPIVTSPDPHAEHIKNLFLWRKGKNKYVCSNLSQKSVIMLS
jgi:hypothetical protein